MAGKTSQRVKKLKKPVFLFVNIQISIVSIANSSQNHQPPAHVHETDTTRLRRAGLTGRRRGLLDLTSAAGTPSGGRQCRTIMPLMGTSLPWGSCSKFFLRSARGEKLRYARCMLGGANETRPSFPHPWF